MRILQVGKYYPPVTGGMERVVCELSEGLSRLGHSVHVVVASIEGPPSREIRNGVSIARLRSYGQLLSQPLISGLRDEINQFKPDIIHFHLPNPLALYLGWQSEVPTCLTIHALTDSWRKKVDLMLSNPFAKKAQALLFSSQQMHDLWTRESGVVDQPAAYVVPFGFNFEYLQPGCQQPQDPQLILFVGRLVRYKGLEVLVNAMDHVDGHLALIGSGPLAAKLRALVFAKRLEGKISFLGSVPDAQLGDWYRRCAVYVQPSIAVESFGISMLEAMSQARPVVSTDLPTGVLEVNLHDKTGLVIQPSDSFALSAAINSLLNRPELAQDLGRAAFSHHLKFSSEQMVEAHQKIYGNII